MQKQPFPIGEKVKSLRTRGGSELKIFRTGRVSDLGRVTFDGGGGGGGSVPHYMACHVTSLFLYHLKT